MNAAIFLDRDGALIGDLHLLINPVDIRVLECVPQVLSSLQEVGFDAIPANVHPNLPRGIFPKLVDKRAVVWLSGFQLSLCNRLAGTGG